MCRESKNKSFSKIDLLVMFIRSTLSRPCGEPLGAGLLPLSAFSVLLSIKGV
jgi:hypothetical protein